MAKKVKLLLKEIKEKENADAFICGKPYKVEIIEENIEGEENGNS